MKCRPGRRSDAVDFTPLKGLRYERVPEGVRAETMMLDGKLDAILSPDLPHAFLQGDKRVARLFAANKDEGIAYFKTTGIFPIMHVTLIKREIVERHPWVPNNLMKAFNQAKDIAYRRILNPRNVALAWVRNALEEQLNILGHDLWEFGLTLATARTSRRCSAIAPSRASCARNARWRRSCSSKRGGSTFRKRFKAEHDVTTDSGQA